VSILEALKRGWWSGWAEFPELLAGGAGLLESLIPGDTPDDPLERLKNWGNEAAQGLRLEGGEGRSQGLLEKIAEGVGAAPGMLSSLAPFFLTTPASMGATAAGAIARPAIAFGAHGLVRHGDEGLPTAIGQGLRGAAEGALFGGVGLKTAGMLVPEAAKGILPKIKYLESLGTPAAQRLASRLQRNLAETGIDTAGRQLGRKALHGLGAGGVVGGMTLAHGGDLEEAVAGGATMGLLGLLSSGKYRTPMATREEALGAVETDIRKEAARRQPAPLEPVREGEWVPPVGEQPSFIDVAQGAKPYNSPLRTQASIEQFRTLDPDNQRLMLGRQNEELPYPLEAYQKVAVTPEQTFALQSRLSDIQQKKALIAQHKEHAKATGDAGRMTEVLEYERNLALSEAAAFEPASGSATQAGRALVNVRWGRQGQPEWVDAVRMFEKQFGKENSSRFKELAMLSEGNPALLERLVKVVNRPKMWDYMMEYWINGLLSGIPTQMVNASSNTLRQGVDHLEKRAGLWAESKFGDSKLTSADRGAIMGADFAQMLAGIKLFPKFAKVAFSESEYARFLERDPKLAWTAVRTKLDHPTAVIPGKVGEFIRLPGNVLRGMDMWFKAIAGQRAAAYTSYKMAYEAFRKGEIKEVEIEGRITELMGERSGEPHQNILDAMRREAEIQTFTERVRGKFGTAVSSAREVPVKLPILGLEIKPVQAVVPFWQTPWNVIVQSVARSPLGLLRLKGLKKRYETDSTFGPEQYYKEVSGTVMGTALWAMLVGAAKMGAITGSGPVNYADRQNLLATGWRPYSIKLGDTYLQMQRLEPFGTILGMAGDAAELGTTDDLTGKAIAMVKENMTNKSFLYGLESFAQAFSNPEQFGSTYYRQMSGSIVPTFFSKAAQAVDPYQRVQEPFSAEAGVPDALAYRIPFVSKALPMRTTAMGEPAERWGVMSTEGAIGKGLSGVQSMLAAMPVSAKRSGTEVEKELDRLKGYGDVPPSTPRRNKKIVLKGVTGENVKLTDEEYAVYDRWHQKAKVHLSNVISSPTYDRVPDAMKAKMLRSIYDKYRSAANKEIIMLVRRRTSVGR